MPELNIPDPIRRLAMVVDLEKYSGLGDRAQFVAQRRLFWATASAMHAAGLDPSRAEVQPTGDGQLFLLPTDTREHRAVRLIVHLNEALFRVNTVKGESGRLRMRAALNVGLIYPNGATGFPGHAVNEMCRLVDSDVLRRALRDSPGDIALIVRPELHRDLFTEPYEGILFDPFTKVEAMAKNFSESALIQTTIPWPNPEKIGLYERSFDSADLGSPTVAAPGGAPMPTGAGRLWLVIAGAVSAGALLAGAAASRARRAQALPMALEAASDHFATPSEYEEEEHPGDDEHDSPQDDITGESPGDVQGFGEDDSGADLDLL